MSEGWLKCQVSKGMFSDELTVKYGDKDSVFVHKSQIRGGAEKQGQVRVYYFRSNGTTWAVLPSEAQAVVAVEEGDLVTQ
jgi:hypothetical protein